ncbi:MAG: SurA N-terminal domain-containing protein [Kiritimatiellia bacterium]
MFIYHFHRIIRHRLVWGVFAVIVSLAFLSVDSCYRSDGKTDSVAKIGGKPVSSETFTMLEREVRGIGRNRTDASFPEIATQVWHQVAAFQVAAELKLGVSREEVASAVQESLGITDGYDSVVHANYLKKLRDNGMHPRQYEQYLEHILTLRKVGAILDSASWVTPIEVDDELSGLTDELTVRLITVSNRFASIGASEAQIQAFFDVHSNSFRLPKRVAVQYVSIPVSNYLSGVSITEDQIKDYFDDHGDKLTRSNATATLKLDDEARAQIVPVLQAQSARHNAYTNLANTFIEIATKEGTNGFAAAAAAFGLTLRQTPFFAMNETPDGIDAGKEFSTAAFDLDPAQPEGRYNVVAGENFIYAITPLANSPSPAHMPALEEVIDRVRPLAINKVRADSFREYLDKTHKDLARGIRAKQNPATLTQAMALNLSTSITFSVHTLYQNTFENYMPVARASLHLLAGEFSEAAVTTDEEAAIFVYMEKRRPGDPLSADALRVKARSNIERARSMGLNVAWMEWNLSRKGLVLTPRMLSQLSAEPVARTEE